MMDLLIVSDPNGLFLCGDTAQVGAPAGGPGWAGLGRAGLVHAQRCGMGAG